MNRYDALAVLGDWTFYQVDGYGDGTLYAYSMNRLINDYPPKIGELYNSIEHAMASAIAEKYTGPRGAGGSGVGTAADWFMRSIGAFEPTRMNAQGSPVLREQVTDQAAATWVAEKGEAAMKAAAARSRGEQAKQAVDAARVDRRYALERMLGVLDGWVQGGRENHDALGHRGEPVGEECWNRFAPDDIRNMINDAAAEIGLEPVWTKGQ
jgi:hypothetical protein